IGPLGKVWFAESGTTKIANIAPSGDTTPITEFSSGITASSQPTGIAAGPDGNLWFTELSGNKVAKITSSGTVTETAVPTAGAQPAALTGANLTALSWPDNSSFTNVSNWVTMRAIDSTNIHGVAWGNATTAYAFGQSGHILKSTDGGVDWALQTSPTASAFE